MKKTKKIITGFLALNILLLNLIYIPLPARAADPGHSPLAMVAQESFFDTYIINPIKDIFGSNDNVVEENPTVSNPSDDSGSTGSAPTTAPVDQSEFTPQITQAVYREGTAYVEWEQVKTADFTGYVLERSINDYGWSRVTEITDPKLTFYNDRPGSVSNSLKYRLTTNADSQYISDPVYAVDNTFKITRQEIDPTGAGYVEWAKPSREVKEYKIWRSINNAAFTSIATINADWYYYQDKSIVGTKNLNILQYKIEARLTEGSTATTDPVTVINQAPEVSINPNLTEAAYYSNGFVSLKWTKPLQVSDQVIYEVWRSTTGDYFYPINQNITQTFFMDNLGQYANYDTLAYKIKAVDQGQVGESNVLYAKDDSFELKTADIVGTSAYLEWSTPAQPVTGYEIYRTYNEYKEGVEPTMTKIASPLSSYYYYQDTSVDLNQANIGYRIKANIANFGPVQTATIYVKQKPVEEVIDPANPNPAGQTYPYGSDYTTSDGQSGASVAWGVASSILSSLILGGMTFDPSQPASSGDIFNLANQPGLWNTDAAQKIIDLYNQMKQAGISPTVQDIMADFIMNNPLAVNTNSLDVTDAERQRLYENTDRLREGRLEDDLPVQESVKIPYKDNDGYIIDVEGKKTEPPLKVDDRGNVINEDGSDTGYNIDDEGTWTYDDGSPVIEPPVGGGGFPPEGIGWGVGGGSAKENLGKYTEFFKQLNPWSEKNTTLIDVIGTILRLATTMSGLIAVAFIVYGGYLYITSGGNPEKSKRAIETITYASIGLVIVLAAFLIINTILLLIEGRTSF